MDGTLYVGENDNKERRHVTSNTKMERGENDDLKSKTTLSNK